MCGLFQIREKEAENLSTQRKRFELEKGHQWIPEVDENNSTMSVSIVMRLTPLGLIKVDSATANWMESKVSETPIVSDQETPTTGTPTNETPSEESSTNETETASVEEIHIQKTLFTERYISKSKSLQITPVEDFNEQEKLILNYPLPMTSRQIRESRTSLKAFIKADKQVEKLNEIRNK